MLISLCSRKTLTRLLSTWFPAARPTAVGVLDSDEELFIGTQKENNFSKIALGHHRDDIIETLFLNMFYGGKLKAMPPKLLSDDLENIVIRPLAYCREKDIVRYAEMCEFPIIPCDLCGSQDGLQRATIKKMLQSWDKEHPGRIETIFRATQSLVPSHLLDESKFDFKDLAKTNQRFR